MSARVPSLLTRGTRTSLRLRCNGRSHLRPQPFPIPRGLIDLPRGTRILVIAPHPDDDILGCGGTIAKFHAAGCYVQILYVTDGSASHKGSSQFPPRALAALREREAVHGAEILGLPSSRLHFLREPDSGLTENSECIRRLADRIATKLRAWHTRIIFAPWIGDRHSDHHAVARAVRHVCREFPAALYEYDVWPSDSGNGFADDVRSLYAVPVSAYRHVKSAALDAHGSQLGRVVFDALEAFTLPTDLVERVHAEYEYFRFVRRTELFSQRSFSD